MNMVRFPILVAMAIFLTGCAMSGYKTSYIPYFDANTAPQGDYEKPVKGQNPMLIFAEEGSSEHQSIVSRGYVPIGKSEFTGAHESSLNIVTQAKKVGATMILISVEKIGGSSEAITTKTQFEQKAIYFVKSLKEKKQ